MTSKNTANKYRILWSDFAASQLDEIFNYYSKEVSIKVAKSIIFQIRDRSKALAKNPLLGKREELLSDRKEEYKRLIVTNYKIICTVPKSMISNFFKKNKLV